MNHETEFQDLINRMDRYCWIGPEISQKLQGIKDTYSKATSNQNKAYADATAEMREEINRLKAENERLRGVYKSQKAAMFSAAYGGNPDPMSRGLEDSDSRNPRLASTMVRIKYTGCPHALCKSQGGKLQKLLGKASLPFAQGRPAWVSRNEAERLNEIINSADLEPLECTDHKNLVDDLHEQKRLRAEIKELNRKLAVTQSVLNQWKDAHDTVSNKAKGLKTKLETTEGLLLMWKDKAKQLDRELDSLKATWSPCGDLLLKDENERLKRLLANFKALDAQSKDARDWIQTYFSSGQSSLDTIPFDICYYDLCIEEIKNLREEINTLQHELRDARSVKEAYAMKLRSIRGAL